MRLIYFVLLFIFVGLIAAGVFWGESGGDVPDKTTVDPYSAHCAEGQYGIKSVLNGSDVSCEGLRSCKHDSDCDYLVFDMTFPRWGRCVQGQCMAMCGSGIVRQCVH